MALSLVEIMCELLKIQTRSEIRLYFYIFLVSHQSSYRNCFDTKMLIRANYCQIGSRLFLLRI